MKFRDYFSIKHILFAIGIVALMLGFAFWQSDNVVKVTFYEESVFVKARRYAMDIHYEDIQSAELTAMEESGEEVADSFDDDTVRTGVWKNDVWGEYTTCIDPDTGNCILLKLADGRTLVFSRKDDATTTELFNTLQTYLGK